MVTETGGRLFEVTKKENVSQIYTEIAAELRAQYRLGYTPDQATASDGYHQIDLSFKDSDKQKNLKISGPATATTRANSLPKQTPAHDRHLSL